MISPPATPAANDSALTPLRFLQRSAEVYPDKDAIVYGGRRYTYAEFADTAQRFAQALTTRIAPATGWRCWRRTSRRH